MCISTDYDNSQKQRYFCASSPAILFLFSLDPVFCAPPGSIHVLQDTAPITALVFHVPRCRFITHKGSSNIWN